jgi:hypothetical protein
MGSFILRFLHRILLCASRQDLNQMGPHRSDVNNLSKSGSNVIRGQPRPDDGSVLSEKSQDRATQGGSACRLPSRIVSRSSAGSIAHAIVEDALDKRELNTTCRCGEAEWCVFILPFYDNDPFFGINITWIPCPAHPCLHSPAETSASDLVRVDSPTSEATTIEGNKRCICSSFEQMMAQPEAREKHEEAQVDRSCRSFPQWPWMK